MTGGKLHQTCGKAATDKTKCQEACDGDTNCKGFVIGMGGLATNCYIATSSSCSNGWFGHNNEGQVGAIDPSETCFTSIYGGCSIKDGLSPGKPRFLNSFQK